MFDRLRGGWFTTHVTSHPDRIYDALNASVSVLRDLGVQPISRRELARARTTLLTRHESDLKDNVYWLGLITHMQNQHVPLKTITCLRDLVPLYEAVTIEDVMLAYNQLKLDDDSIFTCVGTSGKEQPPVPERVLQGLSYLADDDDEQPNGAAGSGSGPFQLPNLGALFTAWLAAQQAANLNQAAHISKAVKGMQAEQQRQAEEQKQSKQ